MSVRVEVSQKNARGPTLELLILAAPIILMMVSRMAMGFIDFVMVSELGTEAQAAVSPASLFVFALGCLGLGIANAVQTFVSQADGRGTPEQAGGYAWQSFYVAVAFAVITLPFALTTDIWFSWLARLGGHTEIVAQMEISYVRIGLWTIAPSIVCIGLNGFFNGVQRPWIAFAAVVVSLAVNLVGNWLLIFGHCGLPALGIAGAAYATVIAWSARALVLALALLLPSFDRRYNTRRSLGFSWPKLTNLIRVGAPTSVGWLVDIGSWLVFLMLIMPAFSTESMAASNVALQLMHLSFMPAMGIGLALCSQVGFAIGEGQPEVALARTRIAFRVAGGYMGLIGILFFVAREPLIGLFNGNVAVISAGTPMLIWAAIFQVFDAMAIINMNALRGAGDTRRPALLMGVCCWVIFVCGGWAVAHFAPQFGPSGPWAMCTLYIIVLGLLLRWRWVAGAWRSIRLFDEEHPAPESAEFPDEAPIPPCTATLEADGELKNVAPAAATEP